VFYIVCRFIPRFRFRILVALLFLGLYFACHKRTCGSQLDGAG
jgi:hypothetical protein